MKVLQEEWIQDTSITPISYPDTLTVYDAGDFLGYSLQKANQSAIWKGYFILTSKFENNTLQRTLFPAHSHTVPFRFFAKETYPAKIIPPGVLIPHWKIQWQQKQLHEVSASDFPWLPQQEPEPQEQPLPSPQQPPLSPISSSQPPQTQSSVKLAQSRPPLQNRNNTGARPRVLPSSNPTSHGRPKQANQVKQGESPSQSSRVHHIEQPQHQESCLMPSLSPRPLGDRAKQDLQSTSSFLHHSNSKFHSPSQRVPHRSVNNPQRPTSAKQPSHAQIAQVPEPPF